MNSMDSESSWHAQETDEEDSDMEITQKLRAITSATRTGILEKETTKRGDIAQAEEIVEASPVILYELEIATAMEKIDTLELAIVLKKFANDSISVVNTIKYAEEITCTLHAIDDGYNGDSRKNDIASISTQKLPAIAQAVHVPFPERAFISRRYAILLTLFLLIIILNATITGLPQFLGAQGWSYVLSGSTTTGNSNILITINNQLRHSPTPGSKAHAIQLTPEQYIDLIIQHMTLDQKLGQMMLVQFVGPSYSLDISTMVTQYNVGTVLIFAANDNIVSRSQLKDLIQQMQQNSPLPLAIAIDQEGGTVDRLLKLDGPRPSATSIGLTKDPHRAMAEGSQDAKDLSYYGINLNLAPVVDVSNVYNPQLAYRTYGNNPAIVTQMTGAYLQGLQQSGQVVGTLKHFPGLGDVAGDPHSTVPYLRRSERNLETIDWSPYRALIAQGNVYSVMVTHEIVTALDSTRPSSLSSRVVTDILRRQLGFQSVIMTDSLTMESIAAYASEEQAGVLAVEAGCDLLMGASTPSDVARMITGLKQAVTSGELSQQRIDDSVRRILMMKYHMGLLHIPTN